MGETLLSILIILYILTGLMVILSYTDKKRSEVWNKSAKINAIITLIIMVLGLLTIIIKTQTV